MSCGFGAVKYMLGLACDVIPYTAFREWHGSCIYSSDDFIYWRIKMKSLCARCKKRFVLDVEDKWCPNCRARLGGMELVDMDTQEYQTQRAYGSRLQEGFELMDADGDTPWITDEIGG